VNGKAIAGELIGMAKLVVDVFRHNSIKIEGTFFQD
jgi:hypothetical protein